MQLFKALHIEEHGMAINLNNLRLSRCAYDAVFIHQSCLIRGVFSLAVRGMPGSLAAPQSSPLERARSCGPAAGGVGTTTHEPRAARLGAETARRCLLLVPRCVDRVAIDMCHVWLGPVCTYTVYVREPLRTASAAARRSDATRRHAGGAWRRKGARPIGGTGPCSDLRPRI